MLNKDDRTTLDKLFGHALPKGKYTPEVGAAWGRVVVALKKMYPALHGGDFRIDEHFNIINRNNPPKSAGIDPGMFLIAMTEVRTLKNRTKALAADKADLQLQIDTMRLDHQAAIAKLRTEAAQTAQTAQQPEAVKREAKKYETWTEEQETYLKNQHAKHFRAKMSKKEKSRATNKTRESYFRHFNSSHRTVDSVNAAICRLTIAKGF